MKNQLFPKEIIENSEQANFEKHSLKSKLIYSSIVLFLIGIICLLPFIQVDVSVRGQGVVRPVTDLIQLKAPVSGNIQVLHAKENSFIDSGEIFAIIETPELSERVRFNENRQKQLISYLEDLRLILGEDSLTSVTSISLNSPRYRRSWLGFRQKLLNKEQEINQLNKQLERQTVLFEKNAISEAALEKTVFSKDAAINQYKLQIEEQLNLWKEEEIKFQNEFDQLKSEHTQLRQKLSRTEIRSPIPGTVQNSDGIFQNTFVYANQVMAEISPDTSLIAEAYVFPKDIGLLKVGMSVRMQIDAYNHNQWGVLTGTIESISRDVIMYDDQPVFRVRSHFNPSFLKLKNGFRGEIKKGMTFQARFIIAQRSLFQLLYDKMDDWLNPFWDRNGYSSQTKN